MLLYGQVKPVSASLATTICLPLSRNRSTSTFSSTVLVSKLACVEAAVSLATAAHCYLPASLGGLLSDSFSGDAATVGKEPLPGL